MMKTQITRADHDNFQTTVHHGTTAGVRNIGKRDYKKMMILFIRFFAVLIIIGLCRGGESSLVFAQEKSSASASQPLDLSALDGISANSEKVPSAPSNPLSGSGNSNSSLPSDRQVNPRSAEGSGSAPSVPGTVVPSGNPDKTKEGSSSQNSVAPSAQNSPNGASTGNTAAGSVDPTVTAPKSKFWELVKAGGFIGVILLILSLIACTIVIQFCLTLRRSCLYPLSFAEEVKRLIDQGKYRFAHQLCGNSDTLLGQVLYKGLSEYQGDWAPVEKALEESVAEESAALYRKSELLSVIGNIAPMLGLLGTVIGMVIAFGELASSDGLGRNLAQGIYFALVTTVDGLIVAIPALVTYSIINNTIASRISEMTDLIDQVTRPMKKAVAGTVQNPAPPVGRSAPIPPFPPVNR